MKKNTSEARNRKAQVRKGIKLLVCLVVVWVSSCNSYAQELKKINASQYSLVDKATGNSIVYNRTVKLTNGTAINDALVDDVVVKKIDNNYYLRQVSNSVDIDWYLKRKDITQPLNKAVNIANALNLPVSVAQNITDQNIARAPKKGFTGKGVIKYKGAYIYKPGLDFIGVPQNIDQKTYTYPKLLTDGDLLSPPLADKPAQKPVTILAHWYNDFGLKRTALKKYQSSGSYAWYDWRWNFYSSENYDPARHPLLGWYRGDDPVVLDWICYWLAKYNVNGVIIDNTFTTTKWTEPGNKAHWLYQLFNHTKNFKQLKYSVWLAANNDFSSARAEVIDNDMLDNVIAKYPNVNCYTTGGKDYPIFYAWDMEGMRGTYDMYLGAGKAKKHLKEMAAKARKLGYGGICIFARNYSQKTWFANDEAVKNFQKDGIYIFYQPYSTTYTTSNKKSYDNNYANYAQKVEFPTWEKRILSPVTSSKSQKPHPSNWKLGGTTPALFKTVLKKAIDVTLETDKPKIVVIYNVSEWGEAGPGLIPNQKDLFGYLEAIATSQ